MCSSKVEEAAQARVWGKRIANRVSLYWGVEGENWKDKQDREHELHSTDEETLWGGVQPRFSVPKPQHISVHCDVRKVSTHRMSFINIWWFID